MLRRKLRWIGHVDIHEGLLQTTLPPSGASSERHCAAGWVKVDAHLSGTDSGATRVHTTAPPLSVRLVDHGYRAALA